MAELQTKAEAVSVVSEPPLAEAPSLDKKTVAALPPAPEEAKALAVVEKAKGNEKIPEPVKKVTGGSLDRDIALAEIEKEKKLSTVKAWEESEKAKAENKAQKLLSAVAAWENSKKAALEAKLKEIEYYIQLFNTLESKQEQLENKKAEYGEKMKNKIALLHKQAEEKRAMIEAKRGEEILKSEEIAAKHRATGSTPKKAFGCF